MLVHNNFIEIVVATITARVLKDIQIQVCEQPSIASNLLLSSVFQVPRYSSLTQKKLKILCLVPLPLAIINIHVP
jgi:hypothetical protein